MKRVALAAIVLSTLVSSVCLADSWRDRDRDDRHDRGRSHHSREWKQDRDDRRDWRDRRYDDRRHWERRHSYARYHAGEYRRPGGYRPYYWRRGDRLPAAYYGRPYRIYNHRGYGLYGPPRGYHWVRVDHDAVLAVIATGVVLDVVYNTFY